MSKKKSVWEATEIAHWTILEETDKRTKAGSIIYKCFNNKTNKVEYKSIAYLVQYRKRNSQKTSPGRYRHFIRVPLEDFIQFGKDMKDLCPQIVFHLKDRDIANANDVKVMMQTAQACATEFWTDRILKYVKLGYIKPDEKGKQLIKEFEECLKRIKKLQQDNK